MYRYSLHLIVIVKVNTNSLIKIILIVPKHELIVCLVTFFIASCCILAVSTQSAPNFEMLQSM